MIRVSRQDRPIVNLCASALSIAVLGVGTLAAAAQETDDAAVLPPGPKNLLLTLIDDPVALADLLGTSRSQGEWVAHVDGQGFEMTAEQQGVLADYLALNLPYGESEGTEVETIVASLPADGRELFVANCFSCHGVAAYYLLQDREASEWMAIFDAPYHRRLLTGDNERETFASYSAYAMPISADDIPEAWQDQ